MDYYRGLLNPLISGGRLLSAIKEKDPDRASALEKYVYELAHGQRPPIIRPLMQFCHPGKGIIRQIGRAFAFDIDAHTEFGAIGAFFLKLACRNTPKTHARNVAGYTHKTEDPAYPMYVAVFKAATAWVGTRTTNYTIVMRHRNAVAAMLKKTPDITVLKRNEVFPVFFDWMATHAVYRPVSRFFDNASNEYKLRPARRLLREYMWYAMARCSTNVVMGTDPRAAMADLQDTRIIHVEPHVVDNDDDE